MVLFICYVLRILSAIQFMTHVHLQHQCFRMLPERAHMRIKSSLNLGIDPQYSPPVTAKVKDKEKCQRIRDLDQVPGEDNIHCLQ